MSTKKKSNGSVKSVLAFHITRDRGEIRGGGNRYYPLTPQVGVTYKATGPISICKNGVHASPSLKDASVYRFFKAGRIMSLVLLTGEVKKDGNKFVARNRKVLAVEPVGYTVPTVTKEFHTGLGIQKIQVVDPEWIEAMERKLKDNYSQNKRAVDSNEAVHELPENRR